MLSPVSPFRSIVLGVQMVGHLLVHDGTVLSHIKHGDLIADVLAFGLRHEDLLREGPHLVIGLCRARQRFRYMLSKHTLLPSNHAALNQTVCMNYDRRLIHNEGMVHMTSYSLRHEEAHTLPTPDVHRLQHMR